MRVALDTNVLVYAEGLGDAVRCTLALQLIRDLKSETTLLPAQCLGELFRVLTGKQKQPSDQAEQIILMWADTFSVADSTWTAFQSAFDLARDHHLPIWDALILSVAAENKCRLLLSEDFNEGFTWRGVTVVNPFNQHTHPLLKQLMS